MNKLTVLPAAATLLAATLLAVSCETKTADTTPADVPQGWEIVWEDNFDGEELDTTVWSRIDRGQHDWNNYMSKLDTLYAMRDGNVVLLGMVNYEGSGDSGRYITGGIWTKDKKAFANGRVEIRAKLNGAQGEWPAFWMLPQADPNDTTKTTLWPYGGEIDIMERLSNDTIVYQTIHTYYTHNEGGVENPKSGYTAPIIPDDYNTYAVEMYADSVRLFVNNVPTFTYPRIETEIPGQFPFAELPFYLLLDMQIEGSWVGAANPEDYPVEMLIDWVRFYEPKKDATE